MKAAAPGGRGQPADRPAARDTTRARRRSTRRPTGCAARAARNLIAAARAAGARRFVAAEHRLPLRARGRLGQGRGRRRCSTTPRATSASAVEAMLGHEREVLGAEGIEGAGPALRPVLRPGHLLRPRRPPSAGKSRRRRCPIVGAGTGIFSFIHVEDAAAATVAALERGAPGHLQRRRRRAGAAARVAAGLRRGARRQAAAPRPALAGAARRRQRRSPSSAVELRGASNAKAKRELGWQPRYPSWRQGFREALG